MLSADHVPVLMHDATLLRTAGRTEEVAALTWRDLSAIEVAERARLGEVGAGERLPSLRQLVALLGQWPQASVFVEIKRAALARAGIEGVLEPVLAELQALRDRAIVISFSAEAVERARARGAARIGWVIERYDAQAETVARRLAPEFLFCNHEKLDPPHAPPWAGPWDWVLYEVADPALALALAARGVRYVESMAVGELLAAFAAARA
jgi:glycerophosphoryl diester phosphodiesterase